MKYLGYHMTVFLSLLALMAATMIGPASIHAADDADMASAALADLYAESDSARILGESAKGILVFPSIVKGGFLVGGQYGEGGLFVDGKQIGRYNTVQLSYGLQAGLQKYGYALFFMTDDALNWVQSAQGWELGVGPTIVVIDEGAGKNLSSTTLKSDVYAFFFSQKGLMGGMGVQGTKISKIN
jgi:lipid-binding SYLF domain-containing protein